MKKILICLFACVFTLTTYAQDGLTKVLMEQGIALHDQGDFEGAIKKYDLAIAHDDKYVDAYYEKAYSLHSLKKLKECSELCQFILSRFKEAPECKLVYIVYGNCLDDLKDPEKAVDIYSEGIQKFPDSYLLYFNKGVTLTGLAKEDDALTSFEKAITLNPQHASSHKSICLLLSNKNKIPSLMAGLVFLCYEPEGAISSAILEIVKKHIAGNVKREGEKNVTISINADDLDTGKKKHKKENNFGTVVLIMALSSSMDNDSTLKITGEEGILSLKIQLMASTLSEQKSVNTGFYWNMYAPFFIEMKKKNLTDVFAHIILSSDKKESNLTWLTNHKDDVNTFYSWVKNYKWAN